MSLDVNSMMEAVNSETIDLYKNLILSSDDNIVCKKNGIIVNNKIVIPPKIVYIKDHIHRLKQDKSKLLIEYYDLYNDILMLPLSEKNTKTAQEDKYEKLLETINSIDRDIDHLQNYSSQLITIHKNDLDKLNDQYKSVLREQKQLMDDGSDINRFVKLNKKIEKNLEEFRIEKNKRIIDFYIEKLPQLSNVVLKDIKEKTQEIKEKEKEKKPKTVTKKEISKKISPKKMENIKTNIKKLIGSTYLKPQSKEECVSQKRSQPYYMSLKLILEEIEKHPELKTMLPKNYKSLPKEKLCEYLYTK